MKLPRSHDSRVSARFPEDVLFRNIEIRSIRTLISLHIIDARTAKPLIGTSQSLQVRGAVDKPVRGVRDVVIRIGATDATNPGHSQPPRVGTVVQVRPQLTAVVAFPHATFDRLWSMALAGHLKHASIVFTKPQHRTARVEELSFSNEPFE
jgi:hypothetical protein